MKDENQVVQWALELFKAVPAKPGSAEPFFSEKEGFVIPALGAAHGPFAEKYFRLLTLSGDDLNKTFHKSWKKVRSMSNLERIIHQILHYASTYGTDFQGEVYIPDEVLEVPEKTNLKVFVVAVFTEEELIEKSLGLLRSGVALHSDTVTKIINLLVCLGYRFTGLEDLKNKEAIARISEITGVYPSDPNEFLRCIIYRMIGSTLLIKDKETLEQLSKADVHGFNPVEEMEKYGLVKLATVFNRHKKIFIALKRFGPNTINRITKLSKVHHRRMSQNPLSLATSESLANSEGKWAMEHATIFALIKAISACMRGPFEEDAAFTYRIRNGKTWVTRKSPKNNMDVVMKNRDILMSQVKKRLSPRLEGKKVFLDQNVVLAAPTSEKLFVGDIPVGTTFYGNQLAVGIYWENGWGARDLDLSCITRNNKLGWNVRYHDSNLTFSGDMTDATDGAVEFFHITGNLSEPFLIANNVYFGNNDAKYKIIIGDGPNIDEDYMMHPDSVKKVIDAKMHDSAQSILGLISNSPETSLNTKFVLLDLNSASVPVSKPGEIMSNYIDSLESQYRNSLNLPTLLVLCGAKIVFEKDDADYDFSLDNLSKGAILELLDA